MKINDFKNVQKTQKYKHLGLFTKEGDCIIKFNTAKMSPTTRMGHIETRLQSPTLQDDYYIIKAKSQNRNDIKTDDYKIECENKIKIESELIPPPPPAPVLSEAPIIPTGYTFKQSLELEVKCKQLEVDLTQANKTIEELEKIVEELEEELLEEKENLSDNSTPAWATMIQESLTTLAPIMDKHFELRERKLNILESQQKNNFAPPVQKPEVEQPTPKTQEIINKIDGTLVNIINELEETPEKQQLVDIYNSAGNLDELLSKIQEVNPVLLSEIMNEVNN